MATIIIGHTDMFEEILDGHDYDSNGYNYCYYTIYPTFEWRRDKVNNVSEHDFGWGDSNFGMGNGNGIGNVFNV